MAAPKTKPTGRPRERADNVKRSHQAGVALAPDEYQAIAKAAEVAGLTVAAWIRGTAVSASATYLPPNYAQAAGAAVPK